jgi:hypothetical protein
MITATIPAKVTRPENMRSLVIKIVNQEIATIAKTLSNRGVFLPSAMATVRIGKATRNVFRIRFRRRALRVLSSSPGKSGGRNHLVRAFSILVVSLIKCIDFTYLANSFH